jgi:acetyl esterase/lipase
LSTRGRPARKPSVRSGIPSGCERGILLGIMRSLGATRTATVLAGLLAIGPAEPSSARQSQQVPPTAPVSTPAGGAGRGSGSVVVPPGKPTVFLWPNGAPGSEARRDEPEEIQGETIRNVHNPSLIVFLPRKDASTGVGLILAPGGGHTSLWIMHEGFNPAQILADNGIAVFVLKNRLQSSGYKFDVEGLADMQRAIRVVRSRAAEWGVDPAKVGAAGFSAGGELAELVALRNDPGNTTATDPIERSSSRPDFQALIYPGKSQLIQPVADSPPAFMAAGVDDRQDISVGLAEAYLRFKKVGVQAELHIYAKTGHGFGIRPERAGQSHQAWPVHLVSFLRQIGMIK